MGFSSSAGPAVGQAIYSQQIGGWATPSFAAWKSNGTYTVTVKFAANLSANRVLAGVNCSRGGTANASAVLWIQLGVYDVNSTSYVVPLGGPGASGPMWTPYSVSCRAPFAPSAGNPLFVTTTHLSLKVSGVVLTRGHLIRIEAAVLGQGFASVSGIGAMSFADFNFGPTDILEILSATTI